MIAEKLVRSLPIVLFVVCGGHWSMGQLDAQTQWRTATQALYRESHTLSYDCHRNVVVLFGGRRDAQLLNDTWEWDGKSWRLVGPDAAPSAREGAAMVYHAATAKTLLVGGKGAGGQVLNDTWEWDGRTWVRRMPAMSPPASAKHSLAFDRDRAVTVYWEGQISSQAWEWDGSQWNSIPNPATPVDGGGITYDAARRETILHGQSGFPPNFQTWAWDGTSWVLRASNQTAPPLPLAYDERRRLIVTQSGTKVWEWGGRSWVERTPSTPVTYWVGTNASCVYDGTVGRYVMTGGNEGQSVYRMEAWEWDGTDWRQRAPIHLPSARFDHRMAYDSARGSLILFGGIESSQISAQPLGDTWELVGSQWIARSDGNGPAARRGHSLSYLPYADGVILFGGHGGSGVLDDTWLFDSVGWKPVANSGPSRRQWSATSAEGEGSSLILFGGRGSIGGGYYGDTWRWDSRRWVELLPTSAPMARSGHAMVRDAVTGRVLLFGGIGASGELGDTWEWDGRDWNQALPMVSPSARGGHSMTYDTARQRVVLLGGSSAGQELGDTWEWDGGSWFRRSISFAPSRRMWHGVAYHGERRTTVVFGGMTNGGPYRDVWEYTPVDPSTFIEFGEPCRETRPRPRLWLHENRLPWIGQVLGVRVDGLVPGQPASMLLGLSHISIGNLSLPLGLSGLGMAGCNLYVSAGSARPLTVSTARAVWSLPITATPSLVGQVFYLQALGASPGSNPAGMVVSNAAAVRVGSK